MDDGMEEVGIPQQGDECPEDKYLNKFVRDKVAAACLENLDKWRDLGIVLMGQSSVPSLDIIELDNRSVMKCCSAMFNLWRQRQPNANWNQLIRALKEVELFALAAQIETLLLPSVKQHEQEVMQQLHEELSDSVLKIMATKLARISDQWKTLGSYLNIDKDTLATFHERDSKTSSIVYILLKIWRNNTLDASLSNLEHIIDEFVSQQPTVAVSRSSSSLPATYSDYTELTDDVLKSTAKKLSDRGDKLEALASYLNVDERTLAECHKHPKTISKFYVLLNIWRKNTPNALLSQLKHLIRMSKQHTIALSSSSSSSVSSPGLYHKTTPQAPVITNHPQDVQIPAGHRITLEVTAYGDMPLHYQWYYEHNVVHDENESLYVIFPVTIRNEGHYYCQVKNQYGVINSMVATVTVTTLQKARHPSVGSEFTYSPLITEKSTTIPPKEGLPMLQTQDTISSADVENYIYLIPKIVY